MRSRRSPSSPMRSRHRAGRADPVLRHRPDPAPRLPAADRASEIHLADYLPQNLAEIERWLARDSGAHDWRPFVRYTLECEGLAAPTEAQLAQREQLTRAKVTRLLQADAGDREPVDARYATVDQRVLRRLRDRGPRNVGGLHAPHRRARGARGRIHHRGAAPRRAPTSSAASGSRAPTSTSTTSGRCSSPSSTAAAARSRSARFPSTPAWATRASCSRLPGGALNDESRPPGSLYPLLSAGDP